MLLKFLNSFYSLSRNWTPLRMIPRHTANCADHLREVKAPKRFSNSNLRCSLGESISIARTSDAARAQSRDKSGTSRTSRTSLTSPACAKREFRRQRRPQKFRRPWGRSRKFRGPVTIVAHMKSAWNNLVADGFTQKSVCPLIPDLPDLLENNC